MGDRAKQVINVVADDLHVASEEISVDVRLADLGADSIDRLGLAIRLEEAFGIVICDAAIQRLRTVGDIVDLVGRATSKHI